MGEVSALCIANWITFEDGNFHIFINFVINASVFPFCIHLELGFSRTFIGQMGNSQVAIKRIAKLKYFHLFC